MSEGTVPNLVGRLIIVIVSVLMLVIPVMIFNAGGHIPDNEALVTAYMVTFLAWVGLWLCNYVVRVVGVICIILTDVCYACITWIFTGMCGVLATDNVFYSWWNAWNKFCAAVAYGYLWVFGNSPTALNRKFLKNYRWVL